MQFRMLQHEAQQYNQKAICDIIMVRRTVELSSHSVARALLLRKGGDTRYGRL